MSVARSDLELEVNYILGNPDSASALVVNWVNRAYQRITQDVEFPQAHKLYFGQSFVANTYKYSLPADYFSIYALYNSTLSKRISQESQDRFLTRDFTKKGDPTIYAIFGSQYWVWRTPSADYGAGDTMHLHYRKLFATLDNDTDLIEINDSWATAVIWEAAIYGYEARGEVERATVLRGRLNAFVNQHRKTLAEELIDRNEGIQVVGVGGVS